MSVLCLNVSLSHGLLAVGRFITMATKLHFSIEIEIAKNVAC